MSKISAPPITSSLLTLAIAIYVNGIFAATSLSSSGAFDARSIVNSIVLAISGMSILSESTIQILDTWVNTPFTALCPSSGMCEDIVLTSIQGLFNHSELDSFGLIPSSLVDYFALTSSTLKDLAGTSDFGHRPPDSGHRIFPDRLIPVTRFSPVTSY
ncbi:hypothetical protein ACLB2K_069540 [Fragaria x ananassa]